MPAGASPGAHPSSARQLWAVPPRILATTALLMAAMLVPIGLAALLGGMPAALPTALALVMCAAPTTRLPTSRALQLVAVAAATSAVAVMLNGQPFAAACFAVLIALVVAPANTVDNGLLAGVLPMAVVYMGSPTLDLDSVPTAVWTVVGAGVLVTLLARTPRSRALAGVSPATAYRHATVTAAAVAVSLWIVLELDVPHGYWVPMTMALVLQPFPSETRARAQLRIWGTVAGGALALVMAVLLPAPAIAVAVVVLTVLNLAYSLLGRYGQAVVALTPGAVLLANLASVDAEVRATVERVVATLVGALLAAALALLLEGADSADQGGRPADAPE